MVTKSVLKGLFQDFSGISQNGHFKNVQNQKPNHFYKTKVVTEKMPKIIIMISLRQMIRKINNIKICIFYIISADS
jgi:hypothetical protein